MKVLFKNVLLFSILVFSVACSKNKIPKDATSFKGHHYKVYYEHVSWQQAQLKCVKMGGMLASVKSKEINDFIYKLSKGTCLWLGASDKLMEGTWLWRDGSPMNYTNWASKGPDNWYDGNEHWLVIGWPSERYNHGKWGDTREHKRDQIIGFVCEWTN